MNPKKRIETWEKEKQFGEPISETVITSESLKGKTMFPEETKKDNQNLTKEQIAMIIKKTLKNKPKTNTYFLQRNITKDTRPKNVVLAPNLTKEQIMLKSLFGHGERTFGTGQNLPRMNRALFSGGGLIKHDDQFERRTAAMFGF